MHVAFTVLLLSLLLVMVMAYLDGLIERMVLDTGSKMACVGLSLWGIRLIMLCARL